MKANIYNKKNSPKVQITFGIPVDLAHALRNDELSSEQKINLVKSYTDEIKDEKGNLMARIPNQDAVILIMALELKVL